MPKLASLAGSFSLISATDHRRSPRQNERNRLLRKRATFSGRGVLSQHGLESRRGVLREHRACSVSRYRYLVNKSVITRSLLVLHRGGEVGSYRGITACSEKCLIDSNTAHHTQYVLAAFRGDGTVRPILERESTADDRPRHAFPTDPPVVSGDRRRRGYLKSPHLHSHHANQR
jgi:hypothetical protein